MARALHLPVNTTQYTTTEETTIARMLRELASNLADAVEAGDMTDAEANEWFNMKADQWAGGLA
jgi:hypothetical protein